MADREGAPRAEVLLPGTARKIIENGPILVRAVIFKGQRHETKRPRPLPNRRTCFDFAAGKPIGH